MPTEDPSSGESTQAPPPDPQFHDEVYALRPWYHDFSRLGLQTDFNEAAKPTLRASAARFGRALLTAVSADRRIEKGGRLFSRATLLGSAPPHRLNQRRKESILVPLLENALGQLDPGSRAADLFCADGYYSCFLAQLKKGLRITGVDLDADELERASVAAKALKCRDVQFIQSGVLQWVEEQRGRFDLVLCAGGLYHLHQPDALLRSLHKITSRFLVIQSAVSLEKEAPDYFVSPAPGWKHGSRFSHARLRSWLTEDGWRILAEERNELPGNRRLRDRGSSYFLCSPNG